MDLEQYKKNAAKDLKRSMIFGNKLIYVIEGREETNIILDALSSKDIFFLIIFIWKQFIYE